MVTKLVSDEAQFTEWVMSPVASTQQLKPGFERTEATGDNTHSVNWASSDTSLVTIRFLRPGHHSFYRPSQNHRNYS